jgi:metal-responsive CopG/Arc/MetJ family transcriptional regulator
MPVILDVMKNRTIFVQTAISVPGDVLEKVTRRATGMHMSRSELFTRAVDHLLNKLETESVTSRINSVIVTTPNDPSGVTVALGRWVLANDPTGW